MSAPLRNPTLITVADPSRVGEARRAAAVLGERLGFDQTRRGELAIVVSEAATNLLKHAGGGDLILRALDRDGSAGVEVLTLDRGPGIPNVSQAMRDGFSTGGTAGTGLGAIRRLATEFDVFSTRAAPGTSAAAAPRAPAATHSPTGHAVPGTVLMARLWADGHAPPPIPPGGVDVGVVCLPKPGEEMCGDAWAIAVDPRTGRSFAIVADGLGHGQHAADASGLAVRTFREAVPRTPAPGTILQAIHAALRGTRGAAVAVVELPPAVADPVGVGGVHAAARTIRFAGVGNIACVLVGPGRATRNAVSHNGTLGAEARRFQEFEYPAAPGALLVLHSDGLGSRWQLGDYPGLANRHPAVIAGVLFRDQRRLRDDATALVVRIGDANASTPLPPAAAGSGGGGGGGGADRRVLP